MKILVVSDLHLTTKFDELKFDYLQNLFQNCDQLIINGDLWSYYSCTFDEFLNSRWKQLFPLMLKKNTIYLYGNHDREQYMDERKNLFSVKQSDTYDLELNQNKFHIEHGHKLLANDSIKNETFITLTRKIRIDDFIKYPLTGMIFKILDLKRLYSFFGKINSNMNQNFIRKNGEILVTGHSHLAESSSDYINTGFIDKGLSWYLIINQDNHLLKFESYKV